MSENPETANEKKEPVVFENVEVYIESLGKSYNYFMTNDIKVVCKKLNSLGYRSVKEIDWRLNSNLAESVREKMEELGCYFSITFDNGVNVLNFWTKKSKRPYIIFLDELLTLKSKIEKSCFLIKEDIDSFVEENNSDDNINPLMMAIMFDAIDYIKLLIEKGENVNFLGEEGVTPLMLAAFYRRTDIVKLLIKAGADVNYCTNSGTSMLVYMISNNKQDRYTEIIKIFKDAGARTDNICINSKIPEKRLTFGETLNFFIAQFTLNGLGKPSQIYKNTLDELDKKAFSKVRSNAQKKPNYHPKKSTVFLLAIGMNLTVDQTEQLLFSAGYAFDETSKFDKTIRDFIQKRNYKIEEIENALFNSTGKYLGRKTEAD